MKNDKFKAIFFDRDGVIIIDKKYQCDPAQIEYTENFFEGYKKLSDLGFTCYMITNQSGVGRGYFTLIDVDLMHHQIQRDLINHGLRPFKSIEVCPHHPDDNCECRKPKTKMVEDLISKFNIDRAQSYFLGDKDIDMELAKNANLKGIHIPNDFKNVLLFSLSIK